MVVVATNYKPGGRIEYYFCKDDNVTNADYVIVNKDTGKAINRIVQVRPVSIDVPEEYPMVVRVANAEDIAKHTKQYSNYDRDYNTVKNSILKLKLQMKLVDIEYPIDGDKIVINFTCEDRVDFRELVKELASKLHSRIELRQIGVRDQAKIVGAIGICGHELCCKKYLSDFDKVSIKMAKNQNLSLNPTKISGMCGRLMCCLSFENDQYVEMSKNLPKIGSTVKTKTLTGIVMYNNIMKGTTTLKVEQNDGTTKYIDVTKEEIIG